MSRRCGVVGSPIAHSLSPALHRAAYAHLGLDWTFTADEVALGELAGYAARLGPQWRGLAVTMPLKAEALRLAASASATARATGAANTLLHGDDGSWAADNTDVPGIAAALVEAGARPGGTAVVLGGGATARSAVAALAGLVGSVDVVVRTASRGEHLVEVGERSGVAVRVRPWSDRHDAWRAPIVVATTPAGALDDDAGRVPEAPGVLLDVVYAPWPTPFARAWTGAGGSVAGGLDLLVHQAVLQVELMTGARPPVAVLRAAGTAALAEPERGER